MWPDMRLPRNTRPGVWRWPMEPGVRCETETPCEALWPREVVALHRAGEALADGGARDIHHGTDLEHVGLDLGAGLQIRAFFLGEAELDERTARSNARLAEVAGNGLREQLLDDAGRT